MNTLRLFLSCLLIGLLAFPAWSESDVVGSAVSSEFATLRDAPLTTGSTVFSGDSISVADNGDARIALLGGDQLDVIGGSNVRLAREHAAVELVVARGSASFRTVPGSSLQALIGDATIRGFDGASVGFLRLDSPDSAVVVAREGKLRISTEHDGNSVVLNEGDAARLTLLPPQPQVEGRNATVPTGKAPFLTPKRLVIIALIVGGGLLAGGLIAGLHEHKVPTSVLIREVTPFHF